MADKEFDKLKREKDEYLKNYQSQKDVILKEYSAEYTKIDKEVQLVKAELEELKASYKEVKTARDTILSEIPKNKLKAINLISDSNLESVKILSKAKKAAEDIISDAVAIRASAQKMREESIQKASETQTRLNSARDMEKKTKALLDEASVNNESIRMSIVRVNTLKEENMNRSAELDNKLGNADIKEKSLILREKSVEQAEKKIELGFGELRKAEDIIKAARDKLDARIKATNDGFLKREKAIEEEKAINMSLAEALDKKQIDIDLQYEHVKNQKEDVERKTRRLEALTKGIKS